MTIESCKNCNYSDELCASGDCPNDTSLTEQRKKGELPSDWYYTKLWKGCNVIDKFIGNQFLRYDDSDIVEVITKVPSYEEWQELKSHDEKATIKLGEACIENLKLKEEIKKLKEAIYYLDGLECPKCGNYHRRGWTCSQCGYGK